MSVISSDVKKVLSSLNWKQPSLSALRRSEKLGQVFAYECAIVSATSLSYSSVGDDRESTIVFQMPTTLTFPEM